MGIKNIVENIRKQAMLRKMNYFSDQQGIMNRYIREKENWDKHFEKTKRFILQSARQKEKGTAVVLGSGWLLDLPLEELAGLFKKVILVDILHPAQIVKKIRKYPNITLLKADITGGLVSFFYTKVKADKKEKALLQSVDSFSYSLPGKPDFVISLNIMCQLHIILVDYIKRFNAYSIAELQKLDLTIQQSHLNMLPCGKTCLVTDIEEEVYDEDDNLLGINPLIQVGLPESNFNAKWQWKFDTLMTYRDNAKTFFNTIAVDF